jgi:molecular chaperone HtpG
MAKRTRKFKTEVQQLLDLVIHSLYSKKEIFLRELISNASDAIDRLRFESLTDSTLIADGDDWKIKITADKEQGLLTFSDNGIGMTAEEVEQNIGTIASSGSRQFLERLKEGEEGADVDFIGQFGVGFYASFMVADKVTVLTRRAGEDSRGVRWISSGAGDYTIEEVEKAERGTDVILHLKEDMTKFAEEWQVRGTVREYSDYITYPVVMDVISKNPDDEDAEETVEEVTLNSMKAIWRKDRKSVKKAEHNEFYTHITHDHSEPLKVIHYAVEGATEFRALLYIPAQAPFDLFTPDARRGLHLYAKNVFINDDCKELLPEYLRFVRGVVDSSDLPLNVSREMLQDDAVIRLIRTSVVGKLLGALKTMKKKKPDDYTGFFQQFGRVLKEGIHSDFENHDKLKDLLLYPSTSTDDNTLVSLRDYVDRMPSDQDELYYLTAENLESARHSPHLEIFASKSFEVLFFTDPVDEWVADRLTDYDGKKLRAIDRGDIDLGDDKQKDEAKSKRGAAQKEYEGLIERMQKRLDADVKEVRFSSRLTDSACCLVTDEQGMTPTMERLMKAMNQEVPATKRILELNPDHAVLSRMKGIYDADKESDQIDDYVDLLFGQALVMEGTPLPQPQAFSKLVSKLMVSSEIENP